MRLEPCFVPEADLMQEWGVSPIGLQILVTEGLQLSLYPINGAQVQGVTQAEKQRFEQFKRGQPTKAERDSKQHGSQRKGDRMLIALMALAFFAEDREFHDDDADHHYKLIRQIGADVRAVTGLDLPRSEESDANAIKEGLALLRARGWRPSRSRLPTQAREDGVNH